VWSDVRSLFDHLNLCPEARILFKRLQFRLPSTKQPGNVFSGLLVHFEVYCKINHMYLLYLYHVIRNEL